MNSKPCKHCLQIMKSMNVKRVYYTVKTEDNKVYYKCEKVKNMTSDHESFIQKKFNLYKV